ncbi:TPA: succinate-semialdehyde dehydrogenase (NADP(+)), partial [Neisseria meningitidis]
MNEYSQLIKHPDISLPPVSDGIKVDNPATGETLAFVRKTDSDKLKNLIQKAA